MKNKDENKRDFYNEINKGVEEHIKLIKSEYDGNNDQYEDRREYLMEFLDGAWIYHKDVKDLINYLYDKVDNFNEDIVVYMDEVGGKNFMGALLLMVIDETLDDWEKEEQEKVVVQK